MEIPKQIDPTDINPADFRNTTIYVEPVGRPQDGFVAIVRNPKILVGEGRGAVTILDKAPGLLGSSRIKGPFIVPYDIFVSGGESKGLIYPGILEEAALIYR